MKYSSKARSGWVVPQHFYGLKTNFGALTEIHWFSVESPQSLGAKMSSEGNMMLIVTF